MREIPQLFTSRWADKTLARLDAVPVGISRGAPRWSLPYRYRTMRELAPSREVFGIEDPGEFAEAYRTGLDEIGVERIVSGLSRIAEEEGGKPLILLCWERPGEFCHRRVLSGWLHERTGVEVPELVPGVLPEGGSGTTTEPTLF